MPNQKTFYATAKNYKTKKTNLFKSSCQLALKQTF